MGTKKKVKVKVKKRKLKIKKILIFFLILTLIVLIFLYLKKLPIKNIYIIGNNILSDEQVIEESGLSNYPSFIGTFKKEIIKKLEKNNYIKNIEVKKKFYSKIYIYVTEQKIISIYNNKLLLEDGSEIDNTYNITSVPNLLSDISSIREEYINNFSQVNEEILLKISEIRYLPNEVDKERFALSMNDGNLVYITLDKITKINKYNSIYSKMEGKKGIIYLDSGDYVEIKE
ncbi:MAG: FtsQ-type POTRA domain-containing protein [Bacilli bacterium]|nr:FtsQ-type POTRA domain-containing protein [Bacilli bacterium]